MPLGKELKQFCIIGLVDRNFAQWMEMSFDTIAL